MPGFGSGGFGSGPFGRFDWSKQVLFHDLPPEDRRLDASEQNGRLEKWMNAVRPLFDEMRQRADDFTSLRNPLRSSTRRTRRLAVTITGATVASDQTTYVYFDAPDPSDPFSPLEDASIGWTLIDADGVEFEVNSVHKVDSAGPMVEVTGTTPPAMGDAELVKPGMLSLLGADYDVSVDQHESNSFQRSTVRDAYQWYAAKGSQFGYDVVGKMSGYRTTASRMWHVDPVPATLPASNVFEIPLGSGNWYTDIAPERILFDDVSADVMPTDLMCSDLYLSGTAGDAIATPVLGLSVVISTDLGDGLWRVLIDGPLEEIGNPEKWSVEFSGMPGQTFWLEETPEYSGPGALWYVKVLAGSSPTFGAQASFEYHCRETPMCGYCAASVLKIDIVPTEVLTDPTISLEDAIPRILRKLGLAVPIHVRITDFVHRVTAGAEIGISASVGSISAAVTAVAGVGYYYDATPADVITVDPAHMAVTGITIFTIP